jgi:hypothetical protein
MVKRSFQLRRKERYWISSRETYGFPYDPFPFLFFIFSFCIFYKKNTKYKIYKIQNIQNTKYKIQNTKYTKYKIQNTKYKIYKIQNTKYKIQNTKYKFMRKLHVPLSMPSNYMLRYLLHMQLNHVDFRDCKIHVHNELCHLDRLAPIGTSTRGLNK